MNIDTNLFQSKKLRYTIYIIVTLWLAVLAQVIMGQLLKDKVTITQAFMDNDSSTIQSSIEIAGECEDNSLSDQDKEDIIHHIGKKIGLDVEKVQTSVSGNVSQVWIDKEAKNATTQIKVVTVEENTKDNIILTKNYVFVRLGVYKNINSILEYKSLLESIFKKLEIKQQQSIVEFTGWYQGNLSLDKRNEITDDMIKRLGGKIAYENRSKDLYTVYAYSGLIDEYITVAKNKVNIQVAMNYNEDKDETIVYLATPILNGSY